MNAKLMLFDKYFGTMVSSGGGGGGEGGAVESVNGKTGNVILSKADVGLSQVTNTSDMNKPVSTAQQTALDAKQDIASMPTTLPNPHALTINGTAYDGSASVEMTIQGGSGGGVSEAPLDGKQYARQSGAWSEVVGGSSYDDSEVRTLIDDNTESINSLDASKADKTEIPDISNLQQKATEEYFNTSTVTINTVDNCDYYIVVPCTSLTITSVGAGTSSIALMTGSSITVTLPNDVDFDGDTEPEWKPNTSYLIVIHNFIAYVSQGVAVV